MTYEQRKRREDHIRQIAQEETEHIDEKLSRLLLLLNHKGVLSEAERIEVEA